jgi:carbon monoxide dehydrogenase subunit G
MKLEHSFSVPLSPDEAFLVLTDVERIAPCMPGASVSSVSGDEFSGTVKVKVGPITVSYGGQARFIEKDPADRRVVIEANGKETRGGGTARASVTSTLHPSPDGTTRVDVITELSITGKPAQFGRGVIIDVGNKIIGQFADALAAELAGSASTTELEPVPEGETTTRSTSAQPAVPHGRPALEPVNILGAASGSVIRRLASALATALRSIGRVGSSRGRSAKGSPLP